MSDDALFIEVHQALHGYADGHTLLETSARLTPDARRTLLMLSDLSGSSIVNGFESYLTAYPLPDTSYYAFARTWYATEMPRPGCVWTHTLLISRSDLAKLDDLGTFVTVFKRPVKDGWSGAFNAAIRVPIAVGRQFTPTIGPGHDERLLVDVLVALYSSDSVPVFLPTASSSAFEALFLALWSQQWAALRQAFKFCTGSLANRVIGKAVFDLQAVPVQSSRQFIREVPDARAVSVGTPSDPANAPAWALAAAADLAVITDRPFRDFIRQHGEEFGPERSQFSSLAELFVMREKVRVWHTPVQHLIETVSTRFPDVRQAIALKKVLFGKSLDATASASSVAPEEDVLRELAVGTHADSFDGESLKLEERSMALWRHQPLAARGLLADLTREPIRAPSELIIKGMLKSASADDAWALCEAVPAILPLRLKLDPQAAIEQRMWRVPYEQQLERWRLLTTAGGPSREQLCSLISAMIEAGCDRIADTVAQQHPVEVTQCILTWCEAHPDEVAGLAFGWQRVLSMNSATLLRCVAEKSIVHASTVALVTSLLDPRSSLVRSSGASMWLAFSGSQSGDAIQTSRIRMSVFFLSLALHNPGERSDELAARNFEVVHETACNDGLPWDCWRQIEPQLPSLSWTQYWDKCERLRRGLVEAFVDYAWPTRTFLQCVQNDELFARLLRSCSVKKSGRRFLEGLHDEVQRGLHSVSTSRRELLADYG